MSTLAKTISEAYYWLDNQIYLYGRLQKDKRLDRHVSYMIGVQLALQYKAPRNIKTKYLVDFSRMKKSFESSIKLAKKDPTSRRLVSFNTLYFEKNYQCFLIMQFIQRWDGYFDMVVYQRSGDLAKFKDDAKFFMFVAKEFKDRMRCRIDNVIIFYAHVHK